MKQLLINDAVRGSNSEFIISIFINAIQQKGRASNSFSIIQLGEATLNLSKYIHKCNSTTVRGSNSPFIIKYIDKCNSTRTIESCIGTFIHCKSVLFRRKILTGLGSGRPSSMLPNVTL